MKNQMFITSYIFNLHNFIHTYLNMTNFTGLAGVPSNMTLILFVNTNFHVVVDNPIAKILNIFIQLLFNYINIFMANIKVSSAYMSTVECKRLFGMSSIKRRKISTFIWQSITSWLKTWQSTVFKYPPPHNTYPSVTIHL